jgi:hypothetical protein
MRYRGSKMVYDKDFLIAAHKHSSLHRKELLQSEVCGCFYCTAIFDPNEIEDWIDERDAPEITALCPKCGIDSVIGSLSGFPVTDKEFLTQMYEKWFNTFTTF